MSGALTMVEAAAELRKTTRWFKEWLAENPVDEAGVPFYVPMGRTKIFEASDIARSVMYQTTTEFLMHLGLNSVKDLPEFNKLVENIKLPETPGLNPVSENLENEKTPTF